MRIWKALVYRDNGCESDEETLFLTEHQALEWIEAEHARIVRHCLKGREERTAKRLDLARGLAGLCGIACEVSPTDIAGTDDGEKFFSWANSVWNIQPVEVIEPDGSY